jgi:hypothetical protein
MDQEEKKEQSEEVQETPVKEPVAEAPDNKETAAEGKDPQPAKKKSITIYLLIAAALVVGILTVRQLNVGSSSGEQACNVTSHSAFGQGPQQVWMDLDTADGAEAGAKFSFDVPEDPIQGYASKKYRVYSLQIYEIQYFNDSDEEIMRLSKGKVCGNPVYDVNEKYKSTNIVTVGDHEVTEYGDGTGVSIAEWVSGDYSYFIAAWKEPLSKDAMEKLILQVQ